MSDGAPGASWDQLEPAVRRCLELAHTTLRSDGLAVGSVVTDASGSILAEGRNRAYDPPNGTDPLEGTPLAHAELNALARLSTGRDPRELTIWSTQRPCSMCTAAISFIEIGHVRAIAADPSDPLPVDEFVDDLWIVLATSMFLLGPLRRGGADHPLISATGRLEPEAVAVAQHCLSGPGLEAIAHPSTAATVVGLWATLQDAADARRRRRSRPT